MGRYTEHGTHINELMGTRGTEDPAACTYCWRAHSKGFFRCPSCESHFGDDLDKPVFPKKNPGVETRP